MDRYQMRTTKEWKYRFHERVAILRADNQPATEEQKNLAIAEADEACCEMIARGEPPE